MKRFLLLITAIGLYPSPNEDFQKQKTPEEYIISLRTTGEIFIEGSPLTKTIGNDLYEIKKVGPHIPFYTKSAYMRPLS